MVRLKRRLPYFILLASFFGNNVIGKILMDYGEDTLMGV